MTVTAQNLINFGLVILGIFTLLGGLALTRSYARNGTVTAALDTVKLVEAQLGALRDRVTALTAENLSLRKTVEVLQEQVTGAAPVRTLIDYVLELSQDRHKDAKRVIEQLGRIEERLLSGPANR